MTNNRFLRSFTRALFDTDLIASRIIVGTAELIWAALLFLPGDTFSRPTYTIMSHFAGEMTWAFAFLIMGTCQLVIVIGEKFHTIFARVYAMLNCLFWVFIVISMLISIQPAPAAISGDIAISLAVIWIFIRPYIEFRGIVHARTHTA